MHKRNIAIIAMLLAAVITVGATLWTSVHRSDTIGIIYFPAILLSVILSGRSPSIGALAEWSSFIVYTLFYLITFIIIYALLLEAFLLRRGLSRLHKTYELERADSSQPAFEALGRAIHDIESSRRTHWVLDDSKSINLTESPDLLGARALEGSVAEGPAKGLVKKLKSKLVKERGLTEAEAVMTKLKTDAVAHLGRQSRP
jgi:hypothetical protein